jgi:RND family efflux transporter MFP subunit
MSFAAPIITRPHKLSPVCRSGAALLIVLLGALLAGGCQKAASDKQEPIRLVRTVTVAAAPVTRQLSFAGQVKSRYETTLGFRVGGKLVSRAVDVGAHVRPGQVLARLDASDLELNVKAAQADLNSAEADRKLAALNFERFNNLRKKGLVSQADYDRQQTQLMAAEERAVAARSRVAQAQNQAQYATLLADADAVISAIDVEVGQVVAAGQPVLHLDRSGDREVLISVPEQQLAALRGTQAILIKLWSKPDHIYTGKLRETAPSADPVTRTYAVKITVTDADADLQIGMTAEALIELPVESGQFTLPLSVLYTKNAQPNVWVVDPGKLTVKLVPVATGGLSENQVIIISGLHAGDIVVSAGANLLVPGQVVKLAETEP